MIVDQIIDPEMQMNVSRVPAYGVSSTYTAHNILQAAYDANGVSSVSVYPCIQGSIYATAGNLFTQTLTALGGSSNPYCTNPVSVKGDIGQISQFSQPFFFNNNHVALPKPSILAGTMLYPLQHAGPSATSPIQLQLQLSNSHSATNLEVVVSFWSATETFSGSINALFTSAGTAAVS